MDLIAYGLKHKIITEEQAKKAQKLRTYSQEAFFQYLKQFNFLPLIQEEDFNLKQKTEFTPPVENKVATQTHQLLPICWKLLEKGVVSTTELNQEICALNLTEREPKNLLQNLLKKKRIEGEQFVTLYKAMNKEAKPLEGYKVTLQEDGTPIFSQSLIEEFGHFKIVAQLGQGGMGTVLQAIDPLDRTVALKKISSTGNISETSKKRFFNEAKVMGNLEHPNIVKVYDFGTIENTDYISMEFVAGHTLDQYLAKGELDLREKVELLKQISEALSYLHENNVLHRDLKPLNIMVNQQEQIKIMDFGLAKKQEQQLTKTGVLIGTPNYMSPEQIDSKRFGSPSFQSDIFSLGIIIYEILTGSLPFTGNTLPEILRGIIGKDPFSLEKYEANIPQELSLICLKCLEKNSKTRYLSMKEITDELELWLKGYPIKTRPYNLFERLVKWGKRNRLSVAGVTFTVLLLLMISLFQWWKQTRATNELLGNASQHVSKKEYDKAINLYAKTWELAPTKTSSALSILLHEITPKKEPTSEYLDMFAQNFNLSQRIFLFSPKKKQFIKFKFELGKAVIFSAIAGGNFRFARLIFRELDALDITQKERTQLSNQIEEAATAEKRRQLTRLDYWVNKIEKGLIQENEFQLAVNEITKFDEPEILEQLLNYFQDAVEYYSNETKQYSIEKEQLYNVILKILANITPDEKESLKVANILLQGLNAISMKISKIDSIKKLQESFCINIIDILALQDNFNLYKRLTLLKYKLEEKNSNLSDIIIFKIKEATEDKIIMTNADEMKKYEDILFAAAVSPIEKKLELLKKASNMRPENCRAQLSYLETLFKCGNKKEAYDKLMILQNKFENILDIKLTEIIFLKYMGQAKIALNKLHLLLQKEIVFEEIISGKFSLFYDEPTLHSEVLKMLDYYIKKYPGKIAFLQSRANIYIIQNRFDEAIIDLEKKLASGSNNPIVFEMLIHCYFHKDYQIKARKMVKKALFLFPRRHKLYYFKGLLEKKEQLFTEAKNNFKKSLDLLDIEINSLQYQYQSDTSLERKEQEKVINKINRLHESIDNKRRTLLIDKSNLKICLGKFKESFSIMSNLVKEKNDFYVAMNYANSARLYSELEVQDTNEKKKILEQALEILGTQKDDHSILSPGYYATQVRIYLNLNKLNEAQYYLTVLEKLDSSYERIYEFKGRLNYRKKKYQQAIEAYEFWLKKRPDDYFSWAKKALCHYELKQNEKAFEALEKVFKMDKKVQLLDKKPKFNALLLAIYGELKYAKKQLKEALALEKKSLQYHPHNRYAYMVLINIYFALKDLNNFKLTINEAIMHHPKLPYFYFERAKYHYQLEKYSESLKDFQTVIELCILYPENKISDELINSAKKCIQVIPKIMEEAEKK